MTRIYVVLFAIAAILSLPAAGADEIKDCADIAGDAHRLECYDRVASDEPPRAASEGLAEEVPETAPAFVPPANAATPAAEVPPSAAQDRFGLDEERKAEEQEPDQISARITKIETRRNGERIFTLDNGQVWVEDTAKPSLHLDVEDTVTIKAGLFGSHRLFGSGNRSSAVDRVR